MHIRLSRLLLPLVSLAMFACSGFVLYWALTAPCKIAESQKAKSKKTVEKTDSTEAVQGKPRLEAFTPLFVRRFQSPLYDPPPPQAPPPPEKKVIPPPEVTLVATMPEPGAGGSVMLTINGATVIRQVGDTLSDGKTSAKITEINSQNIVLEHEGKPVTVTYSE